MRRASAAGSGEENHGYKQGAHQAKKHIPLDSSKITVSVPSRSLKVKVTAHFSTRPGEKKEIASPRFGRQVFVSSRRGQRRNPSVRSENNADIEK